MAKSFIGHLFLLAVHIELHHAHLNDTLDLSINVRKNQTGHIVTKWSLVEGSQKLPENMNVDIHTSISEKGGKKFLRLHGLISVPPPKPADYELFQGVGYYKFYPDGAPSFYEASSICTEDGGHLAIINSEAESKALETLYARYPSVSEWAWLGFHDLDVQGQFVTIFGDPLNSTGFTRWHPGQPDNVEGNEHCGSTHRNGGLNDLPCDTSKYGPWPFICEWDLSWGET